MTHSTNFFFQRSDGSEVEIFLDDMKLIFDGDGWHEPETVTVEDYRVFWSRGGHSIEVQWMNSGIVARTCPVDHSDVDRFFNECFERAEEYAADAEPQYYYEDDL